MDEKEKFTMTFIWPVMLFSLLLVPLLVLFYLRLQRRRRKLAAAYGSLGLTPTGVGGGDRREWRPAPTGPAHTGPAHTGPAPAKPASTRPGARRHVPAALFLCGLTLLLTALARPQTVVSLPRVEGAVILAFDVSGSMSADDFKPTRMDAAKAAALDFIERQPSSVQIGVIGFSDSGFGVQAPTNDRDAIRATINRLTPQRGTSLGRGIQAAFNLLDAGKGPTQKLYSNLTPAPTVTPTPMPQGAYTNAAIVLLSDGENNENPDPMAAAQFAADRGVRIYTVGIGSAAGSTLHVNGITVHTRLDEALLQNIAALTGGTYYNAENEADLRAVYDNLDPQLTLKPQKMEVTSLFTAASLLALLVGGVYSLRWFGRMP